MDYITPMIPYLYQYKVLENGKSYISTYRSKTPYDFKSMSEEIRMHCKRCGLIFIGII